MGKRWARGLCRGIALESSICSIAHLPVERSFARQARGPNEGCELISKRRKIADLFAAVAGMLPECALEVLRYALFNQGRRSGQGAPSVRSTSVTEGGASIFKDGRKLPSIGRCFARLCAGCGDIQGSRRGGTALMMGPSATVPAIAGA